ncbi:MAG TPA: ABC transporter permease [Roseiflexaceae bacterium]|nr:ABC transporter permease [Roseiflexaceae bacterium]
MLAHLRVPWAFVVRDFREDSSYKIGFLFRVATAVINVAIYYFIASAFGSAAAPYLSIYSGNYFAFVIIGVAFSEYLAIGIGAIGESIRQGQTTGTLELMLLSPTRLVVTLLSSSLWSYVFATLRVVVYLIVGVALGMRIDQANVLFALLSLVVAIVSFNALGLFSASVIILMKRGDTLGWALRVSSLVLSGVYYPVEVLPGWLRALGQLLPLTHALELLRRSLLLGEGFGQLWSELLILAGLTIVLLPLGVLACHLAIQVARTDGSLSHY